MMDFKQYDAMARGGMDKLLEPPPDPRDSPEWEQAKLDLWNERIMDIRGYFLESITERNDFDLGVLAALIMNNETGTYTEAIGATISKWVIGSCEPSPDEVKI